jgi:hypothetical protein
MAAEPILNDALPQAVQRAIARVRAREASARDAAAFDLPARVGPFEIRQMLPVDALLLHATENAAYRGVPAAHCPPEDIVSFVALLSGRSQWRVALRLTALACRPAAHRRMLRQLDAYVAETFVDWPKSIKPQRGDAVRGNYVSHLVHMLAATYHWRESDMLRIPVRRLMIYRKHIMADDMARQGKTLVDISDEEARIKAEWMDTVNERGRN